MIRGFRWIPLSAMLMSICHGAETMAYHFASEPALDKYLVDCPVLNEAPAATPFVTAGDELHDITGLLREKKVPLEKGWALWNQTKHLLVVHGVMLDQWRVEELAGFREQARQAKLTVDWIRSGKPGDPTAEDDPVFASVVHLGKSGMKSEASVETTDPSGKWTFSAAAEPFVGGKDSIDSRLDVTWKGPDGDSTQQGYYSSPIFLTDGQTVPFASWYVAGHGPAWRIDAKGEILLSDGTAWRDARLLQKGDKFASCLDSTLESKWVGLRELPVAGDRKLFTVEVEDDDIRSLAGMSQVPPDDPFANKEPEPRQVLSPDWPVAVIPKDLGDYLDGSMLDLRACLSKSGVAIGKDDFTAYDPLTRRVVVWCESDSVVDSIAEVFMVMDCRGPRENIQCEAWLADGAAPDSPLVRISLLSRSGMKAPFGLLDAKEVAFASFEVEPTFDSGLNKLDLRYDFLSHLEQGTAKSEWHSQSNLTLANGTSVLMDAAKLPGGLTLKQGLRVTVVK